MWVNSYAVEQHSCSCLQKGAKNYTFSLVAFIERQCGSRNVASVYRLTKILLVRHSL